MFIDKTKYRKTLKLIDQLPISKNTDKGLVNCNNSIERLLWVLSTEDVITKSVGYKLSLFQEDAGKNLISVNDVDNFHSYDSTFDFNKDVKPLPDTYMLSGTTMSCELFKTRVMVRMKDLDPSISFKLFKPESVNKQEWEEFLRIYNLISLVPNHQ